MDQDLFVPITRVLVAEVQTPIVQVIQPQANLPPSYTSQAVPNPNVPYTVNPPYPMSSTGI